MDLKIGDRVKCIRSKGMHPSLNITRPKVGTVYTVRGYSGTGTGIYVDEIINGVVEWSNGTTSEPGFSRNRFEKVVEIQSDMIEEVKSQSKNKTKVSVKIVSPVKEGLDKKIVEKEILESFEKIYLN